MSSLPNQSGLFGTSPSRNWTNYMDKFQNDKVNRLQNLKVVSPPQEKRHAPFIIGIAGGTAGGKTTVCEQIVKNLADKRVAVIAQDSFYKSLTEEQSKNAKESNYNFDHPDAFDDDLLMQTLKSLKDGKDVDIPVYSFVTHRRLEETTHISGADVIIIEGILVLYNREIRDLMNMRIFVDTDADTRLARRIVRDIQQRGRDLHGVLSQYERFVKPSFDDYILPTKKYADLIIPRGGDNYVAIDLLVKHIKIKLQEMDGISFH
jgi:uridine kinase